jgi:serine/threonine-protein kinase
MGAPEFVGKYCLLEPIGITAASTRYRAMELSQDGVERVVLLDRFKEDVSRDEMRCAQLTQTVSVLQDLGHSKLVAILDFGRVRDELILVREYVQGTSLRGLLSRLSQARRTLSVDEALWIALEVLRALEAIESFSRRRGLRLVHEHIRPGNIRIAHDGGVKLIGLGVAELVETPEGGRWEIEELPYRSPEQLRGGPVDERSDLYSVGAVLFEAVAGWPLFLGKSPAETEANVLAGAGAFPDAFKSLAPALATWVGKSLDLAPSARFSGAAEACTAISPLASDFEPAVLRQSLGRRVQTLFEDDIRRERARLEKEQTTVSRLLSARPTAGTGPSTRPTAGTGRVPPHAGLRPASDSEGADLVQTDPRKLASLLDPGSDSAAAAEEIGPGLVRSDADMLAALLNGSAADELPPPEEEPPAEAAKAPSGARDRTPRKPAAQSEEEPIEPMEGLVHTHALSSELESFSRRTKSGGKPSAATQEHTDLEAPAGPARPAAAAGGEPGPAKREGPQRRPPIASAAAAGGEPAPARREGSPGRPPVASFRLGGEDRAPASRRPHLAYVPEKKPRRGCLGGLLLLLLLGASVLLFVGPG